MVKSKRGGKRDVESFSGKIAVGIDTHKKNYHVCLWSVEEDCKVDAWVQPPDPASLMRKLVDLRGRICQIVYEAGPVGFGLARALLAAGWPAIVTSPGDVPTGRNEAKSDSRDAQRLASLSSRRLLSAIYIPTAAHDHERQFQRQRQKFLRDRKRAQCRIKSFFLLNSLPLADDFSWSKTKVAALLAIAMSEDLRMVLEGYVEDYQVAERKVAKADRNLEALKEREPMKKPLAHLCTIPGVASRTALEFILEMGPAGRFQNRFEVAKYQGLAPEVRSSGQSRKEGPLNRSGNRHLKTLLIEAAWRWRAYDEHARTYYNRIYANTGNPQKAITALAHKLGTVMWNLLERGEDYMPGGTRKTAAAAGAQEPQTPIDQPIKLITPRAKHRAPREAPVQVNRNPNPGSRA